MKPETRYNVLRNYGSKVVEVLDRMADAMCQEAAAFYADDEKTRSTHSETVNRLHEELVAVKGPTAAVFINPSAQTMKILRILIQDFHDLDDVVERSFDGSDGVLADSEASSPFIYCTEAAAPKVIKALDEFYPGVKFAAAPVYEGCTVNTVLTNWHEAKAWKEQAR